MFVLADSGVKGPKKYCDPNGVDGSGSTSGRGDKENPVDQYRPAGNDRSYGENFGKFENVGLVIPFGVRRDAVHDGGVKSARVLISYSGEQYTNPYGLDPNQPNNNDDYSNNRRPFLYFRSPGIDDSRTWPTIGHDYPGEMVEFQFRPSWNRLADYPFVTNPHRPSKAFVFFFFSDYFGGQYSSVPGSDLDQPGNVRILKRKSTFKM